MSDTSVPDGPKAQARFPDLEGMDLLALDSERARLLGGRESLDVLTEEELERYIAINAKMRLTARTAGKPPANGGGGRKKKAPEMNLSDLLKSVNL